MAIWKEAVAQLKSIVSKGDYSREDAQKAFDSVDGLKEDIKEIKDFPIANIINHFTPLKPKGVYLVGECPLTCKCENKVRGHELTVTPHKNVFYCFGCHIGGDGITFVREINGCCLKEAIDYIRELKEADETK